MNTVGTLAGWLARSVLLFVLAAAAFVGGALAVTGAMPDVAVSEPGLVSPEAGLLIISLAYVATIAAMVLTSRWHGWKLALGLAFAFYGAVTVMTQIETWFFLSSITVGPELLPRLFLMGLPPAFLLVPAAVWVLGRAQPREADSALPMPAMSVRQWVARLAVIVVAYLVLYWGAGYFIAWQNPEVRAFYGQPGDALPFLTHTANTLRDEPLLLPFQMIRALLWVACALPVIYGSRLGTPGTALLVGVLFSVPQNIGHILANPLIPAASVRMSHMVETASSTFLFGLIVAWLLHRERDRPAAPAERPSPPREDRTTAAGAG
jgi:hypothetical protein